MSIGISRSGNHNVSVVAYNARRDKLGAYGVPEIVQK